ASLDVSVIYFSDTGVTPYGKMTRGELVSRLDAVIGHLKDQGVTHLAIGCNAASTAIDLLETQGVKIEGMISSGVEAAMNENPSQLGLIGGRRTVLSGVYRRRFREKGIKVEQRIAQPLSGMIENGDVGSENLRAEARHILAPIRNCSHILLACTHYPAIASVLKETVSSETQFIDPSFELVRRIKKWKLPLGGKDIFLTSGDPAKMKKAAFNACSVVIANAERIKVR
ncbi:MAG: glutamate racemase, partial [Candidatus Binatia bacterium]